MYLDKLAEGHTLEVFDGEKLIFSSSGHWLHPLFQLMDFLKGYEVRESLSLHDSISGTAAAVLTTLSGVKRVNADMASEGALEVYRAHGVQCSYSALVDRIQCVTETLISPQDPLEESARKLRRKANLTQGLRLEVKDLSFSYEQGKPVLSGLSLTLESGDAVIISGENGAGKTTLLKCILKLLRPDSGTILYDGKAELSDTAYIKQRTDSSRFPLKASEVVALGSRSKEDIELAMRRTGCYMLKDRDYFTLSGGEAQKVNLARALAGKARLLVLDEPSASLDKEAKEGFVRLISSLSFDEMPTILLVSHDREVSESLDWPRYELVEGKLRRC